MFRKHPYRKLSDEEIKEKIDSFIRVSIPRKLDETNPDEKEILQYITAAIREMTDQDNMNLVANAAMREYLKMKCASTQDATSKEPIMDKEPQTQETQQESEPKKKFSWKKIGKIFLKVVVPTAAGFGAGFAVAKLTEKKPTKNTASKPAAPATPKPAAPAKK